MYIVSLFIVAPKLKQPKFLLIIEQINQLWHAHMMGYYAAVNKEQTATTAAATSTTCNNMGDSHQYNVKQKKSHK